MVSLILFIIIGIELDIMNGWYLALVIILAIARGFELMGKIIIKLIEKLILE